MSRFFKGRYKKVGLPPGSIVYLGDPNDAPVSISLFNYDNSHLEEKETTDIQDTYFTRSDDRVSWININGIHQSNVIERFCNAFNIHPLNIEDIMNREQRPKIEDNVAYVYVVMNMLTYDGEKGVVSEQVSLIITDNHVLSFQEQDGDTFEPVRSRLRSGKGKIRKSGADYLFYSLIDTIVDNYFLVLEKIGDKLEELEDDLLQGPEEDTFNELHRLKKEIISLRRSVWPLRDVVNKLERDDIKLISQETRIFMRDIYDHTIQVIDAVETYRDMLSSMVDLYQSMAGNRMNQVMKVLTIISTIFIPLTFITGLYGMNFNYIPELNWKYGYFMVWGISLTLVGLMLYVFRKRKWI
ncbi:MAG: magnesium/cobalt transporter CorA [Candidatus Cyclobacteriaceae bacterium M3_2C_046]